MFLVKLLTRCGRPTKRGGVLNSLETVWKEEASVIRHDCSRVAINVGHKKMLMCCLPKHLATNWGQLRVLKWPEHVFSMIASVHIFQKRQVESHTEFECLSLSEDWKSHWSKSSSLLFATADVPYMQSGFFPPFIYKKSFSSFSSHSWVQSFIFLFIYFSLLLCHGFSRRWRRTLLYPVSWTLRQWPGITRRNRSSPSRSSPLVRERYGQSGM